MTDDVELPESLPYTATLSAFMGHMKCQHCGTTADCHKYILRFPEDLDFLEWESGEKERRMGKSPRGGLPHVAYVPFAPPGGQAVDGQFCSELCAKKSYFPVWILWRLRGNK